LAIKQQEQAAYEALMANPLRLREMQERNGIKPKKDKKDKKREKEEKKRRKEEKRRLKERSSRSPSPLGSYRRSDSEERYKRSRRSPSPYRRRDDRDRGRRYGRSRSPRRSYDSRSPPHRESYHRRHSFSPDEDRRVDSRRRSASPRRRDDRRYSRSPRRDREPTYSKRAPLPPPRPGHDAASRPSDDRAAKLAAMSANATAMSSERQERLKGLLEKEKAELEAEERARAKSQGMGSFLSQESKKVFGGTGGLEERIRRGRGGMVVDAD
jgi:hypothetical protein